MIEAGRINELIVKRKTDIGYMLTDNVNEVFLHNKQVKEELIPGNKINAFIMFDAYGRLTATLEEPIITTIKPGFVEVVSVKENLGVFVKNNTFKDVLISKDNLPYNYKNWPEIGDKVFAKLKVRNTQIIAKPLNMEELDDLEKILDEFVVGDKAYGYIQRVSDARYDVITENLNHITVYKRDSRKDYRLGERVSVMLTRTKDHKFTGSLNLAKEFMLEDDGLIIINYLKKHRGIMNYTAKSSSEEIEKVFKMSRKAFKRALGVLYKDGKVSCEEHYTKLLEVKDEEN